MNHEAVPSPGTELDVGFDETEQDPGSDPESLRLLLGRLAGDGRLLLRQEVALARLEISESVRHLARESAIVAAGGFLIAVGLVILVVFVVLAIGRILWGQYWLSTLLVGSALVLGGFLVLRRGRRALQAGGLKPERTIASLQETKDWVEGSADRLRR